MPAKKTEDQSGVPNKPKTTKKVQIQEKLEMESQQEQPCDEITTKSTAAALSKGSVIAAKKSQNLKSGRKRTKTGFTSNDYVEDSEEIKKVIEDLELDVQSNKSSSSSDQEEVALPASESESERESSASSEEEHEESKVQKTKKKSAPAQKQTEQKKAKEKVKEKPVQLNEKQSKLAIAEYMVKQNRPYSVQNVLDNLHGKIPKKICQTVLDVLCEEKVLQAKEYGKAKIYLANQDNFPEQSKDQLKELDDQIKKNKDMVEQLQQQLKVLTLQLKDTSSSLTNEQLAKSIADLDQSTQVQQKRLQSYTGAKQVTEEEVDQVRNNYNVQLKNWRLRRKGCLEIVDAICEMSDQKRSAFFEQLSLEDDKDVGMDINQYQTKVNI